MQNNPKSSSEAVKAKKAYQLLLLNDDIHSFEFVIDQLVAFCDHNPLQAEQCAWIVHLTGKCVVKIDTKKIVYQCAEHLQKVGLTVEIKNNEK